MRSERPDVSVDPDRADDTVADNAFGVAHLMRLTPEVAPASQWRFSAPSGDIGTPRLFGGQLLGQALAAAQHSIDTAQQVHSLHAHFLRAGSKSLPVDYAVSVLRDGRNITSRRVEAWQHDRHLLSATVSFSAEAQGIDHQHAMPDVPSPDQVEVEARLHRAIELRPVPAGELAARNIDAKLSCTWMRARQPLPDAPPLHRALLAYLSDYTLLRAALRPHVMSFRQPGVIGASLDHALWFRQDARVDDWLLYCTQSPHAAQGRAVCTGNLFARDGRLVASVAQEGLVRQGVDPASAHSTTRETS